MPCYRGAIRSTANPFILAGTPRRVSAHVLGAMQGQWIFMELLTFNIVLLAVAFLAMASFIYLIWRDK